MPPADRPVRGDRVMASRTEFLKQVDLAEIEVQYVLNENDATDTEQAEAERIMQLDAAGISRLAIAAYLVAQDKESDAGTPLTVDDLIVAGALQAALAADGHSIMVRDRGDLTGAAWPLTELT